jgi:hypothetical protein
MITCFCALLVPWLTADAHFSQVYGEFVSWWRSNDQIKLRVCAFSKSRRTACPL